MKPARKSQSVAKKTVKVGQEKKLRMSVLIADDHSVVRFPREPQSSGPSTGVRQTTGRGAISAQKSMRADLTYCDKFNTRDKLRPGSDTRRPQFCTLTLP
jgi:hypothetical protein